MEIYLRMVTSSTKPGHGSRNTLRATIQCTIQSASKRADLFLVPSHWFPDYVGDTIIESIREPLYMGY